MRTRVEGADWDRAEFDSIWVAFHDYYGVQRGKYVPAARLEDVLRSGVSFAKANWDMAINDHQIPQPVFDADSGDFRAIPDEATSLLLPHRPGVLQFLGSLVDDEGTWDGDPRARLQRQVALLDERGLRAEVGIEAEFMLFQKPADEWVLADAGPMFALPPMEQRWEFWQAILSYLAEAGIGVHQFGKEFGPAQYELSFLPADPVAAVDQYLLAKQILQAVAADRRLLASFMPKPEAALPGNGLHVHLSLETEDGADFGVSHEDPQALNAEGSAAVAGLLVHAPGQSALGSPSVNSYKRLVPASWAPAHVAWGMGNRGALLRIPGPGPRRHFEYRSGDASCNPYLHLAGLLAAVQDGLTRHLSAPPPVGAGVVHWNDAEADAHGAPRLPSDLGSAMDALEADPVLLDAVGPVIARHYPLVKRFELQCYQTEAVDPGPGSVTDWERATYLTTI